MLLPSYTKGLPNNCLVVINPEPKLMQYLEERRYREYCVVPTPDQMLPDSEHVCYLYVNHSKTHVLLRRVVTTPSPSNRIDASDVQALVKATGFQRDPSVERMTGIAKFDFPWPNW